LQQGMAWLPWLFFRPQFAVKHGGIMAEN
jgi:hypothetical protein